MSQASQRVVAIGFNAHSPAARLVQSAFHGFAELADLSDFDPSGAAAVIIGPDAGLESGDGIRVVIEAAQQGKNLVLLGLPDSMVTPAWEKLAGVKPLAKKPDGEWFFKLKGSSPLVQRLPEEFSALGRPSPLELHDDTEPLLSTSIGLKNHVTAAIKRLPHSNVVTLGLNPTSKIPSRNLATILRRAALLNPATSDEAIGASLGVAIIGYGPFGGMGTYHALAATEVPGLELVAVVDREPDRLQAARKEFPKVRTYSMAEEAARDEDVDICIVATPPMNHAAISMDLLDAGKHVITEKPMCLTLNEANQLIAKSKSSNRLLSVNQNRRWDQDFRALAQAVSEGKIGELFNVETFVGGFEHPCRAWHSDEAISGGAVFDWGSHHIDWILQLYGSAPQKVGTTQHKRVWHDVTNVDQIRVHMLWDDGREAEFFQSDIAAIRKPKFFIQGTSGTIIGHYRPLVKETVTVPFGYEERKYHHAEAPATLKLKRYQSESGLIDETIPLSPPDRFALHKNIADHLLLGDPLEVEPKAVAGVIATLEAAQLSGTSGSRYIALEEVGY